MRRANKIQEIVRERNITNLFHFTKAENLENILHYGLLSRDELNAHNINAYTSHANQINGADNAVSISVSSINRKMFNSKRHESPKSDWVIIGLCPSVLWKFTCKFLYTNAGSKDMKNTNRSFRGEFYFSQMFANEIPSTFFRSEIKRSPDLPSYFTTCSDAEVQVLRGIPPQYILGVWINDHKLMKNVERCSKKANYKEDLELVIDSFDTNLHLRG